MYVMLPNYFYYYYYYELYSIVAVIAFDNTKLVVYDYTLLS